MKPSWKDAPEWAQWLAMDGGGEWYWYECEPKLLWGCWGSVGEDVAVDFGDKWTHTLEPRPAQPAPEMPSLDELIEASHLAYTMALRIQTERKESTDEEQAVTDLVIRMNHIVQKLHEVKEAQG